MDGKSHFHPMQNLVLSQAFQALAARHPEVEGTNIHSFATTTTAHRRRPNVYNARGRRATGSCIANALPLLRLPHDADE